MASCDGGASASSGGEGVQEPQAHPCDSDDDDDGEGERKEARFTGGTVDFTNVTDWSTYPSFPREDPPPQGLLLPERTVLPWPTPTSP
jgi:hypothetical protein